jgi:hypothetical protein
MSLTTIGYSPEPTVISLVDSDLRVELRFVVGSRSKICSLIMDFCEPYNLAFNVFSEPMSIAKSAHYPKDLAVELTKYLTANDIRIQPPDGDVYNLTA